LKNNQIKRLVLAQGELDEICSGLNIFFENPSIWVFSIQVSVLNSVHIQKGIAASKYDLFTGMQGMRGSFPAPFLTWVAFVRDLFACGLVPSAGIPSLGSPPALEGSVRSFCRDGSAFCGTLRDNCIIIFS
jgi:hypothetical protein